MILEAKKIPAENQEGTGLKILTPKQMLLRLPIALAQVKAGNNSESLLNEIKANCLFLFFLSVKTNHKNGIKPHDRIYSAMYKKWTLYL